ncbi:MAG: HAD-IA family hydrolase [Endomicrobiia bacterium]
MFKQFDNFDNFIFDLDGTLIDSSAEVLRCLEKSFNECNVKFDKSKLTSNIMGPSLAEIVKIVIPTLNDNDVIQNIVLKYRSLYDNDSDDKTQLYDGVFEWLLHLKSNNKKIFIATNKPKIPTIRLIKNLNIDFFNDIYTVDKYDTRKLTKQQMIEEIIEKYSLIKNKTVMVGDIITDIDAANKAGIKSLAVLWGYAKDKNVIKEKSDFYLGKI